MLIRGVDVDIVVVIGWMGWLLVMVLFFFG